MVTWDGLLLLSIALLPQQTFGLIKLCARRSTHATPWWRWESWCVIHGIGLDVSTKGGQYLEFVELCRIVWLDINRAVSSIFQWIYSFFKTFPAGLWADVEDGDFQDLELGQRPDCRGTPGLQRNSEDHLGSLEQGRLADWAGRWWESWTANP